MYKRSCIDPKTYFSNYLKKQLEKHFTSPYYIPTHQRIHVFGEQDSIMLALHGSNLQQYLDNLSL